MASIAAARPNTRLLTASAVLEKKPMIHGDSAPEGEDRH
jgi:hypothetical protein